MKKALLILLLVLPAANSLAFAGGSSGGTPPLLQDLETLALMSIAIEQLPKVHAKEDDLRRAKARLSIAGNETTDLTIDGTTIKIRKLRDNLVDKAISQEILPQ